MTTHILENYTLMSNAKTVQDFQIKLCTEYGDGDFLRLFNDNFDENIKGRIVSCDIGIYDISDTPKLTPTLDVELMVYNHDNFCVITYTTNLDRFFNNKIVVYTRENS